MDKTEFEAELRRDGFRPIFASLRPNMKETVVVQFEMELS
jgi:hypothetical protein